MQWYWSSKTASGCFNFVAWFQTNSNSDEKYFTREGVILTNFFKRGSKIGLKIDLSAPETFGGKESETTKVCHVTSHKVGIIICKIFGGLHPKNLEEQKPQKWGAILDSFDFDRKYLSHRSRYRKLETKFIEDDFNGIWQKFGELWSANKKVRDADADPPQVDNACSEYRIC